jgi:palmitoyl-protein thioesterase
MHNLITFGSQHMGVSDIPTCKPADFTCQLMRRAARSGVYTAWAQHNLVQAQYFRDPGRMETYLEVNAFLPDVNGEVAAARNASYKENLQRLENLVLVIFAQDVTVVPKESAWFGSERVITEDDLSDGPAPALLPAESTNDQVPLFGAGAGAGAAAHGPKPPPHQPPAIIPMRLQPLYVNDWIGLRALDEAGKVHFDSCDAPHMHLPDECWVDLVKTYLGGAVAA